MDFVQSAVQFFLEVRKLHLRKKPATAELIGWARLMIEAYGAKLSEPISRVKSLAWTLAALAKNQDDLVELSKFLTKFTERPSTSVAGSN